MKFVLIFAIIFSSSALAIDFNQAYNKLKNLAGVAQKKEQAKISMPKIPSLKKDATTVAKDLPSKTSSFDKLDPAKKRTFNQAFIEELYLYILEQKPTRDRVATYLNVLEQGGSREGVYRALILSDDYRNHMLNKLNSSKPVLQFFINTSYEFLALKYLERDIKEIGIHLLKKTLVEKLLEVIDLLAQNPKDLYSWYALLSAKLAQEHRNLLNNQLRKNQDPHYHFNWAKAVPFQQIKSEVIIKVHIIMNHLNR